MNLRQAFINRAAADGYIHEKLETLFAKLQARNEVTPISSGRGYWNSITTVSLDGDTIKVEYESSYGGGDRDQNETSYPLALVENPTDEAIAAYIAEQYRLRADAERQKKEKEDAEKRARDLAELKRLKAQYPEA